MKFASNFFYFVPLALACTSSRGDVFTSHAASDGGTIVARGGAASTDDGGAAGRGAEAGTLAAGTGGADCSAAIYCTGFETSSDSLFQFGTGTAELVTSPIRSGSSALRVSVTGADEFAVLDVPLTGLSHVGVRLWVMLDANVADLEESEVHVLATLRPAPELGAGGANKVSIDLDAGYQLTLVETITPAKKHSNSPLTPGDWHCLQLEISGAAGMEQATFDMHGSQRARTMASPSVVLPGGFQWLSIGIESAPTGSTPLVLYYDDIVVGETAAPCND